MRILDACTAACRTRTLSQSPSFVPPIIACASSPAPSRVRAQTANRTVWNKSTRAPPARDARAPPFTRARPRARRRPHREIRVTSHRLTHRLRRRRASLRLRRSKTTSDKNRVSHSSRVRAPSRASRAPPRAFASRRHSGFRRRLVVVARSSRRTVARVFAGAARSAEIWDVCVANMIRVAARAGVRRVVPTRATSRAAEGCGARATPRDGVKTIASCEHARVRSVVFNAITRRRARRRRDAAPRRAARRRDEVAMDAKIDGARDVARDAPSGRARADEATRTRDDDGTTDGRRRFQTDAQRSSCGCTRSKR